MTSEDGQHSWGGGGVQGSKRTEKKVTSKSKLAREVYFWLTKLFQSELGVCSCPAGWIPNLVPATRPNHMAPSMRRSLWANWTYCGGQDVCERMQFSTGYLSKTGTGKIKTEQNKQTTKP